MAVDLNQKRLTDVYDERDDVLDPNSKNYDSGLKAIDDSVKQWDTFSKEEIKNIGALKDEQIKNANEQTDFAIEKIEQQKDQANKDYIKEQSGAYVDWQKQSNAYGANAEHMASMGMFGTGYSESSQVSMYNTWQARVTAARESFALSKLNYENAITEARLQNNALLAEIAYNAYKQQLEITLKALTQKDTLLVQKASAIREINSRYDDKWKTVLNQINTENALAEQQRQFNETQARQKEQLALEREKFAWQKEQAAKTASISKSSGGGSKWTVAKSPSKSKVSKNTGGNIIDNKIIQSQESAGLEVDMGSVIALGYGPISASKLDSLVSSGQVVEYVDNGKLKYRNNVSLGKK